MSQEKLSEEVRGSLEKAAKMQQFLKPLNSIWTYWPFYLSLVFDFSGQGTIATIELNVLVKGVDTSWT